MAKKETKSKKVKIKRQPAYEQLDEKEKAMVDMAVHYYPYSRIAETLHLKYNAVAKQFYRGGKLFVALNTRRALWRAEAEESYKHVDEILRAAAADAAETIAIMSRRPSMPGIVAAKDALDRSGFKPVDKMGWEGPPTKVIATIDLVEKKNGRKNTPTKPKADA